MAITYLGIQHPTLYTRSDQQISGTKKYSICQDLQIWDVPTISWFGWASILKMTILLRLLYTLQTSPNSPTTFFFVSYKAMCMAFLWGYKSAQIGWAMLVLPKYSGGIGFPDRQRYYWAVHLAQVVDWKVHSHCKGWVTLKYLVSDSYLYLLPWFSKEHVSPTLYSFPHIGANLHAFDRACAVHALSAKACSIRGVRGNPDFIPGLSKT